MSAFLAAGLELDQDPGNGMSILVRSTRFLQRISGFCLPLGKKKALHRGLNGILIVKNWR